MADTSLTVTITGQNPAIGDAVQPANELRFVTGTIVFAAGDFVAGGAAFLAGFLAALNTAASVKTGLAVGHISIEGIAGYRYSYVASSGKVTVFRGDNDNAGDAPAIEHAAGALDAAVVADIITFLAVLIES